jgi:hypothetical protein
LKLSVCLASTGVNTPGTMLAKFLRVVENLLKREAWTPTKSNRSRCSGLHVRFKFLWGIAEKSSLRLIDLGVRPSTVVLPFLRISGFSVPFEYCQGLK